MKKIKIIILLCLFNVVFSFDAMHTNAYNEENYLKAGMDFMCIQYSSKNIEYDNINKYDAIDLYDYNNQVIAKLLVINRDNNFDYVILDFVVDDVNGFGINENEFISEILSKEKIYYLGQSMFAYEENGVFFDFYGNEVSKDLLEETNKQMIKKAPKEVESGYDGILSWSKIKERYTVDGIYMDGYSNNSWDYIPGFDWNNVSGSNYYGQSLLNYNYYVRHRETITGTCSATAMTNMAIYYDSIGYDSLINNNIYDTFDWFIDDTNWKNWGDEGIYWDTETNESFVNYANTLGYDYYLNINNSPSFDDFINEIGKDNPIYTYIYAPQTNGTAWAHSVVTVGYEQFEYEYTEQVKSYWFFGWHYKTVTKYKYYNYLRVIDGWSTSNSAQYIDCNNFYSSIMLKSFGLSGVK